MNSMQESKLSINISWDSPDSNMAIGTQAAELWSPMCGKSKIATTTTKFLTLLARLVTNNVYLTGILEGSNFHIVGCTASKLV